MILTAWILAFLGLAYFFSRRLKKIDPKTFKFSHWWADNINLLIKGTISIILMMILFTNEETVRRGSEMVDRLPGILSLAPYPLLAGFLVGLLNFSFLEVLRVFSREKLKNIFKK